MSRTLDETRYYREKDGNLLRLEIYYDEDPMHPRHDWDNVATMVCFHRRYNLGDVYVGREGKTVTIPHTNVGYDNSSDGAEAFEEWARKKLKAGELVIASLKLYDHSGITMSVHSWGENAFGTGWDSGIVGWCFITKDRAYEELAIENGEDWTEEAKKHIIMEVGTYDNYLTGSVYRFVMSRLQSYRTVENGAEKVNFPDCAQWDEVNSSGGFFGFDHEKSGLLANVPDGAIRIREDELPKQGREAA